MIYFHAENISFQLKQKMLLKRWIKHVISAEQKIPGDINYIFVSDEALLEMNRNVLNHDYYTDIITFDYCEESSISGDLFISIDRVNENSMTEKTVFENELHRVMIHGILHLCGYGDKSKAEEKKMRAKEDFYLNLRNF
jgi:probable rRNA maturation factor